MVAIRFAEIADGNFHIAWKDGERVFLRGWHKAADGSLIAALAVRPAFERPDPGTADRLAREYEWKDELDSAWAVRPLDLLREGGRTVLLLEDPGGEPLAASLGAPLGIASFLRLAIGIAVAIGGLHRRGLVHKDIKPDNIIVDQARRDIRLTGFGIASRLRRERQAIQPPETIAGTLAYMAPEQTGWMNRSIDSRSDLYALGVTMYEMLTGRLPFGASDPMEWVHCHIARKPTPAADRVVGIPSVLSMIVMKLLAKTAEDRYQTAGGLASDLRRCLTEFEERHQIEEFPLGQHDTSDRLTIPEKLYGREGEIETLLASFDRIIGGGAPELVLVSGYAGVGKSSVVNELHKVLPPSRGLFASGKFDQYKRDIPYSTLAQAFRGLVQSLLSKSDAELSGWQDALQEALGTNGQLMVDLVPELVLIIGDQPPVAELSPKNAKRRFQLVFRRFLSVFARPEHPLALFLDDLQWLDAATLDLIEDLVTQPGLTHLMLIGAYRDNEVDASHPLIRKLGAISQAGSRVQEIRLGPLGHQHLLELITDLVRCEPAAALTLTNLVHAKTAGNPFFAIQFLYALADEGLLTFDVDAGRWSWDLERLHNKGYTDNVVDLMVGMLVRRSKETQQALQLFACLGAVADIVTLGIVLGIPPEQVHSAFWDAVCQELVERRGETYRFTHDRVQEAAYSMIPGAARAGVHLRIGRLLIERTAPEQREDAIFEIVSQFNRGAPLITSREEREQVAQLNLMAGKRAKASTAYASALVYFNAGAALLSDDPWQLQYPLTFALWLNRAECEFLSGSFDVADMLLQDLLRQGATRTDKAAAYGLKIGLHVLRSESPQAVECALECLLLFGIKMHAHPSREQFEDAFEEVLRKLEGRSIESLIDLPRATDPDVEAAMQVLSVLYAPAFFTDEMLVGLYTCHMINLTLAHGMTEASPHAFAWFGVVLGHVRGRYAEGYRFARLACDCVEKHGFVGHRARTLFSLELVSLWTRPVSLALDDIRAVFTTAIESGDVAHACFACNHAVTDRLLRGDSLHEIWPETERGLAFARRANFRDVVDILVTQQRFIQNMRGRTISFSTFDGDDFDESCFEQELTSKRMPTMICWYWIMKAQARFMSGDFDMAIRCFEKVRSLLWSSPGHIQLLDYHYFSALTLASVVAGDGRSESARADREEIERHCAQLGRWAESCPSTFADKYALVRAEVARLEGREIDAERLYEEAIRLARESGFVQNEGIANELAARFYAMRGFEKIARAYLRDARQCYESWGADGKVRQLDHVDPHLWDQKPAIIATSTIGAPIEHLDLATIIKVSQAVSSEIVPEKLIDTLMRTAIEQAGAERGLLILAQGGAPRIAAEATTHDDIVVVHLRDRAASGTLLPESVLRYVLHSRESMILGDAATQSPFAEDPYIKDCRARSILGLPLINRGKLVGALYLENNLTPNVFASSRMTALKLLASQAAISLENARLYGDLQEREAKIRHLVDANIIGIIIWDFDGGIIEANDTFLRMLGFDRSDFLRGDLNWIELTPPQWRGRSAEALQSLKKTGTIKPYEREYFRKDGSRVPVLIGAARLSQIDNQGVSFVLDLTERRRAESEARESERRYRETQMELAHANRVATMGQLTASIAHEVNQPITAMIGNAGASLRWLDREPPDLGEVRQLLERIAKDGRRVGSVIDRTRDLVKKAPLRMERVDINEAIDEVIGLTRAEAAKNNISVRTQFAEGLPSVGADRIQLQQVILNLIVNAVQALSHVEVRRELFISTEMNGPRGVLVSVRDSGAGINAEELERLFDPFYTTKPGGMGMGLSICRSIVESHGGKIWATAQRPHGAAFHFTVPHFDDSIVA
jgi:PAS domain S-box-containing protein